MARGARLYTFGMFGYSRQREVDKGFERTYGASKRTDERVSESARELERDDDMNDITCCTYVADPHYRLDD